MITHKKRRSLKMKKFQKALTLGLAAGLMVTALAASAEK
jgi:hypothetical protein